MGPSGGTGRARCLETEQEVGVVGKARAVTGDKQIGMPAPTLLAV